MRNSVIIPTYNGAQKLSGILDALVKQTLMPDEIIVAVDGSTDNTLAVLEKAKINIPNLIVLRSENGGRSVIRNKGAAKASSELLIFFDDDMIPLKDCIQNHVKHHEQFPGSILTGGLSEEINDTSPDLLKYKSHLSNKWNKELRLNGGQLSTKNIFITAANFSISRKLFYTLNGFDVQLKDAEDFDLAVRAYKAGVDLYFNEAAFAWHNDKVSCASYIKRQRQYAEAHKKLAALKPWFIGESFLQPVKKPSGLKKIIYQLFLSGLWVKAADNGILKILPRRLRYKIYDAIITANGVFFPDKVAL